MKHPTELDRLNVTDPWVEYVRKTAPPITVHHGMDFVYNGDYLNDPVLKVSLEQGEPLNAGRSLLKITTLEEGENPKHYVSVKNDTRADTIHAEMRDFDIDLITKYGTIDKDRDVSLNMLLMMYACAYFSSKMYSSSVHWEKVYDDLQTFLTHLITRTYKAVPLLIALTIEFESPTQIKLCGVSIILDNEDSD